MTGIVFMGNALRKFGLDFTRLISESTANPVHGLFIGILVTSIVQSSSTITSIVVGLVGGGVLSFAHAIPIIMGSNVGTTITNTLVSLSFIKTGTDFKRAYAASTIHDIFNILTLMILFPLQVKFNIIGGAAEYLGHSFYSVGGVALINPLNIAVEPMISILERLSGFSAIVSLSVALILIFVSLWYLVKVMKSMVLKRIEGLFNTFIFKAPLRSFLFGLIFTSIVQSSSVTTSLIVPLAGVGILTLEQIYPYTLGANVGTTITAILASFATANVYAVSLAFSHTLFNMFGILIWLPLQRIPFYMATQFAGLAERHKSVPFLYILVVFFLIPLILMHLF